MNPIDKLTELFSRFPGIGPRQARRFVFFLLREGADSRAAIIRSIGELSSEIIQCEECMRFFSRQGTLIACSICSNIERDRTKLMIVSRDSDLDAVEKSGAFPGLYFVLGGSIPILEKKPERRIRKDALLSRIEKLAELREIILALNATADGENTEVYLRSLLDSNATERKIEISVLGRGLSSGLEIEYSDPDTLKNALKNRSH